MKQIQAKQIFRYQISLGVDTLLSIPKGAKILRCADQYGKICLWSLVEIDKPLEPRRFRIYGTGWDIVQKTENIEYIDTVLMAGGSLVWHIFELK